MKGSFTILQYLSVIEDVIVYQSVGESKIRVYNDKSNVV
jgi:hypothetical protein